MTFTPTYPAADPSGLTGPTKPAAPRTPPKKSIMQTEIFGSAVKRDELMHLSRQLGAFVHAGLPLIEAVRILRDEARSAALRNTLADIEEGLRRGEPLSDCLDRHPRVFPEYYRGILRSAELTGRLDVVLEQLAKYLERDLEARRKINSALAYPLVIAAMSLVTVVILAVFVLPRFKTFFESLNATLPLPTRILLAITDFFAAWWWAVLAAVLVLLATYLLAVRTQAGRYARDAFLLRLPVIARPSEWPWSSDSAACSRRWPRLASRCPPRSGWPRIRCATGSSCASSAAWGT